MNNISMIKINETNMFDSIDHENLTLSEQKSIIRLAYAIVRENYKPGQKVAGPVAIKHMLVLRLTDLRNEVFGAIFLSNSHTIIDIDDLFQGTVNRASVFPRVVVQKALECNASAVIFYHNHPSGDPEPSTGDREITERLKEALALFDVRVLDHLIVGGANIFSLTGERLL